MRIGLVARADHRGLGIQTRSVHRALKPDRTLVIDPGPLSPYKQHFDSYPDARVTPWSGAELSDEAMDWLIDGSDIIYTAETPYDYSLYDRARAKGVKTVCHVNPEFFRHLNEPELPKPDAFWAPSTWRLEWLGEDARLVPMPIDKEMRLASESKRSFLHIAGHRAARDRNGTLAVLRALRAVRKHLSFIVRGQSHLPPISVRSHISACVVRADLDEVSDLYRGADVLVLPRRYGGLCLPIGEAAARGIPSIVTDREPDREWTLPELCVQASPGPLLLTQAGNIPTHDPSPRAIAQVIDRLIDEPALLEKASLFASEQAERNSWERLKPLWMHELRRVCG